MNPRHAFFACLERSPPALFEAALWIAAEHDPAVQPVLILQDLKLLEQQVSLGMPLLPADELGQPLLRCMNDLGFAQDDFTPLRPAAALLDKVLQRKRGQPLAMGLIAMELARRLGIPMVGVNFPGHFLLRVPGADHLLDPCGGRRLYPNDCRELLQRQYGPNLNLQADHLHTAEPRSILQRLSRNLRQLHLANDNPLAALIDAERVLELGNASAADYLARASLYQRLDCPNAERFDLEHALMLSEDPIQRLRLTERLGHLPPNSVVH
ncbi:SirB1 family protein [Pseudomonas grimontii]|jgi:regulator of sirC expression with transglutaminase-like and TPR domain|uniref:Regulator of sirC expression, contains transglutaminase-like and TPR domains n=1 Tax=Pseudomonas grimontii TaxID=129847 RepID=A0A1H1IX23_9PSED|nr:transglutaminase family protein [Pseudomonas grimontii]MCS3511483.1 regulator of sirC expression with transglutaminase-like and TPR domain [Pseudomonas grimontii]TWR70101.1 tetratricopeptide repeat protein [Pseudomonas grimontii]SDR42254.1 Regulator of sirC expression, contains transglutaminase-like and TPR domains [Pseudomonas grimontii]